MKKFNICAIAFLTLGCLIATAACKQNASVPQEEQRQVIQERESEECPDCPQIPDCPDCPSRNADEKPDVSPRKGRKHRPSPVRPVPLPNPRPRKPRL